MHTPTAPMRHRRSIVSLLVLALVLALTLSLAPPAAADHVLEIRRHTELYAAGDPDTPVNSADQRGVLTVGKTRVRYDQAGEVSWILDTETKKLTLVRHEPRIYHVFDIPLELERYATESEGPRLASWAALASAAITVTETDEHHQVDGWDARRVEVVGEPSEKGPRVEYELWLSDQVPGGDALYRALVREFGAADLSMRPMARRLSELAGFPVVRRSVTSFPSGLRSVDERRLVSVDERPMPASFYEPPAGYREEPFSVSEWLTLR